MAMTPSWKVICSDGPPNSGEAGSAMAISAMALRRFMPASSAADPAVAAPNWPPEPGAGGSSESPISTRTSPSATPSVSAAIWASTV